MVRTILAQDRILHIKTHPPTPVSVTPPATPERPLRANPHRPIWGQRVRQPGCTLGRNLGVAGLGPHGQLAPPPPPCTCFAAHRPSSVDVKIIRTNRLWLFCDARLALGGGAQPSPRMGWRPPNFAATLPGQPSGMVTCPSGTRGAVQDTVGWWSGPPSRTL